MDLDFSITGFVEGCGPRFNRGIWALFKVVARRLYSLSRFVLKKSILSVWYPVSQYPVF